MRPGATLPARITAIATLALLALFLQGGMSASLARILAVPATAAQVVAAIVSLLAFLAGYRWLVDPRRAAAASDESRWNRFCLAVVLYAVLLRLVYLGVPELLFEEAYYWNYVQHLDIGYLDHPLMVAWVMWPFVALMGNIEFAVRAGAFLCWPVTAWFSWRLAMEVLGQAAAYRALVLIAVLPVYFSFGLFMSPDAPLAACWAAALYFMHRIVVGEDPRAWLWLGVAIGLGMISKYTISLFAAAVVLYVLIDRPSRKWLSRPEPYIAALVALVLFTPVVAWNWQNDWASFSFQSQERLAHKFSFSLPRFVGNVIALLTPTGIVSVIALVAWRKQFATLFARPGLPVATLERSFRLLAWLALFPLAVFAAASLIRASKLNWTGCAWLALVPFVAVLLTPGPESGVPRLLAWCRRAWPPTIVICLLLYGGAMQWLGPGIPGAGYPKNFHLIGWRDFGRDVEVLVQRLRRETGQEVLVVGMDRNRIASGLAFYRTQYLDSLGPRAGGDPVKDTASEHLFGSVGLMYALWFPAAKQEGRTMLLVSKDTAGLTNERIPPRVTSAGDIGEIEVRKNGKAAGRYYYRLITGYRAQRATGSAADAGQDD
jgi:dolichol-phosphate mannosyltransferase